MTPALALALCVATLRPDARRPVLSGPELIHDSADGVLRVHYTLTGADAIGDPALVELAERGAARMLARYVTAEGWAAPQADAGRGGNDRLDLYLMALDSNGYTYSESPAGTAFMEVDPAGISLGAEAFQSVVGHETFHVLQVAEAGDFVASWIAEAGATYAQYLVFDDSSLTFARNILWRLRLAHPDRALDDAGRGDRYEYAGLIWVKYLVDRAGGDPLVQRDLWDAMGREGSWVAGHDDVIRARLGLAGLDAAAAEYAAWNWYACSNDDGAHYDPDTVGCSLGGFVTAAHATVPGDGTSVAIGARGSAYVAFDGDCSSADIEVSVTPTQPMKLQLLGKNVLATADAAAAATTTLVARDWNRQPDLVVVGTNVGAAPATFRYQTRAQGSAAPDSITVTPTTVELSVDDQTSLAAVAHLETCADRAVTQEATWSTSDASIATVDKGHVTALRGGAADISASVGGVSSAAVRIVVRPSNSGCSATCRPSTTSGYLVLLVLFGLFVTHRVKSSI